MRRQKGFTMVELLVVLIIVAILAAIATPLYLANVRRARAAEAVATMSLIRQVLRERRIQTGNYPADDIADISDVDGLNIQLGVVKYFSNDAFTVILEDDPTSDQFTDPAAVDFVIQVDGSASDACSGDDSDDCATNQADVANQRLEMDNTGRIFVSYDAGDTWAAY